MDFKVRLGQKEDMQAVFNLITELAVFEKEPDAVEITVTDLVRDGFSETPKFKVFVAEQEHNIIGIALFYERYSTWKGKCLYLEDFYVKENTRKEGVGSQLYNAVIEVAKSKKVRRMDWQVLDWNQPAIDFYVKHNAKLDNHWINGRLTFEY